MNLRLAPRFLAFSAGLLAQALAGQPPAAAADLTIDASSVVREIPVGLAGANVGPRFWQSSSPDYYAGIGEARIGVLRVAAYPIDSVTDYTLAHLDERVSRILSLGATPLFLQGINSVGRAHSDSRDAVFVSRLLKLDGTPGGTHATNMAFLVQRYKAPPYNLTHQFWQVGNEPDINVNYQVEDSQEYIDLFQSIHNQLVASGLRANVVLCGPSTSWDYGFGGFRDTLMNDFLAACKDQVDVVTRHIYAQIYPWEAPVADTAYNLLNAPIELIHFDSARASSQGRGEKALLDAMAARGVSAAVGTGVTEMNLFKNVNEYRFTITQGLWFLLSSHYAIYNPRSRLTLGFQFDTFNSGATGGMLGYYDSGRNRSFPYWAAYIHGRLTGTEALAQSSSDDHLVVTATRDEQFVYAQVLNRNTSAITATLTVQNAQVSSPTRFVLSATGTPLTGTPTTHGSSFSQVFPAMSAQIFRFPRTDYVSGIVVDNTDTARVTRTGAWQASGATPGYHGPDYLHDNNNGKGSKSVRYAPALPRLGRYEVYARWTSHENRAASVPIDIVRHGGAGTTVTVNQTVNGGAWVLLGTHVLDPATAAVTVRNQGTAGYVVADAVRFVPVAEDIVVDNTDSAHVTLTGAWTATTVSAGYHGVDYLHDGNAGKGAKSVRYAAPVAAVGSYRVYARWTSDSNRASAVPIDITGTAGTATVTVDQTINGGYWYPIGTYTLDPASSSVVIRNAGTTGFVVADAVRFVAP